MRANRASHRVATERHARGWVALASAALVSAGFVVAIATAPDSPAGASGTGTTSYAPQPAQLATITNGVTAAPWNEWQGDPSAPTYSSVPPGTVLPVYTPGGATTGSGASAEPNLAVMPGANSGTDGDSPYPSGTVGTPGPLAGYCGAGNQATASAGTPARQPAGTVLPLAPAYFPHIVANADGSLTGYFDYRPKDADEAIVAARSTDGGKDWIYQGEALEQNPGYCPSGDINDDGNGHPNVLSVGGVSRLYTLQRPAGDAAGVPMLVHTLNPTSANPLNGLPAAEQIGIDPDSFVPSGDGVSVPHTGGTTIDVQSTGTANSPEDLVAGGFVDLTQTPVPTAAAVITCTAVTANSLTTCTAANPSGETVAAGDLIEQVIGYDNGPVTVPTGPNTTTGDGGLGTINVVTTSGGTTKGYTYALTGTTLNNNAPDRAYIDGVAVYCDQANANPTTKLEDCTTGTGNPALSVATGDPITSDPIIPASAATTSGLVAPDGIVGVLPSYPGAPSNTTIVMYTEKVLSYFIAGTTTNSSSSTFSSSIPFTPSPSVIGSPSVPSDLPSTISATQPVTVDIGDTTKTTIIPVTCTGLTTGATYTLTGCSVPSADSGDKYSSTSWIGAPNATTVPYQTLALTGEGSNSTAKLFKNNEDLSVLRVAYTSDGINFSDAGLANAGVISGASNGATNYADITNPTTTVSPANLNAYATAGTADATEMRWVGSAGSIITNPDGSYGLFLSGAWAGDGDSDAFNQIFYTSSTDGQNWSIPTSVVSTDYTFSASAAQDTALAGGSDQQLGISAYYSGRAYGPSVVQNANGTLTMLFAGYRLPKVLANAGTVLGTNPADLYTVGSTDPVAYRNILTETLSSTTSPAVGTTTTVSVPVGSNPVTGDSVTYTAAVGVDSPGTGDPTGTVRFTDGAGTLCSAVAVSETSPDTATCTVAYTSAQIDDVTATYSGDSNYATSFGVLDETIAPAPTHTTVGTQPSTTQYGQGVAITASVAPSAGAGTPTGTVTIYDGTTPLGSGSLSAGSFAVSTSALQGGVHDLSAVYAGDGNFHGSTSLTLDYTVSAAPSNGIQLTAPNSGTYGGDATLTATGGGSSAPVVLSVDTADSTAGACSLSGSIVTYTAVGTCVIDANQAADADYQQAAQAQASISVAPAVLTVTAQDASRAYGQPNPTFTASYSGFVLNDNASVLSGAPQLSTTAIATSAPAAYPIAVSQGTLSAANYTFSFQSGTLTVTKATGSGITFHAPATGTYGGSATLTPTGGGPSTPVVLSVDTADSTAGACSLSGSTVTFTGVGTCVIDANQAADTDFDQQTEVSQTIVISPAVLTVTAQDATRAFGQANPSFTVAYSGFKFADTPAVLHGAPRLSTTATPTSNPDNYPIVASIGTLSAANYTFAFQAGNLTVTKAGTAVTPKPVSDLGSLLSAKVVMTATLKSTATGNPIGGQQIVFASLTGSFRCTETTNASGVATCSKSLAAAYAVISSGGYTATYAGTIDYLGISATAKNAF